MNTVCSATHVAAVACRSHTRLYIGTNGERLGNREIDGKGEPGLRVPEQCLIGNRAANNYPCAQTHTPDTHARSHWLKLGHTGADCAGLAGYKYDDKNRCSVANDDRRHVNTTTEQRAEWRARDARFIVIVARTEL